jgi:kinesin family protein C2/C3
VIFCIISQEMMLMFVQLNPDGGSCSQSLSTLMFVERVSGVQVDVEWSSKEGKDVRELMEQVLIHLLIYLFKSYNGP